MEESRIVIVGAGYAGILTAKKLAKKFKKAKKSASITIIDRNPFHTMLTELHEVAANRVDEDSIKMSLKRIFAGRKVNVVLDNVESIDFNNKLVVGKNANYDYDYLVIAAGSKPTFFGVEGAKEHSYTLWSFEDAVKLRDHILDSFRKAASEINLDEKKRLLTFYIVGAGFTGVEMVGELAEYVPFLCEKYEIDRELVTIVNVDVLPRVVTTLPEKLSEKVERRYRKMGIKTMMNTGVCCVGSDFIEVKQGETESCVRYSAGTVIWAAGIESCEITSDAAKVLDCAGRGRIKVDSFLRSTDNENVFVVGDNMFFIAEGEKKPVPQMVENCEQSADTAAHNIFCAVTEKGEMEEYKPAFHGMMVSIGGRYGVARVGGAKKQINLPSFFAMFTKHFINIIYFIQVLGWNKVFSYAKHEFFTIRNRRSFVGGHFSNRTPSFLLVPLRIWLGAVWLYEGLMKVVDGWFTAPQLNNFFGGANSWYNSILSAASNAADTAVAAVSSASTAAPEAVVDAVTSATPAVEGAVQAVGTVLVNFNFLGFIRVILVSGKALAESVLGDFAFKLDILPLNWFINNFVLASDSFQMFMQIAIVIAEILIGLALIGGLFTAPAAAVSVVLQGMFLCTTGLYLNSIWMLFAGIAVLIGAGRIFGLDYYVMPYLKKLWKRLPFVRRLYIYND